MVTQNKETNTSVRFGEEDRKVIKALRKKLGIKNVSDLLRQALRALAAKEGVSQ
jgi:Arc/MetJ-type ribon-helix-helix transcriptional regulator